MLTGLSKKKRFLLSEFNQGRWRSSLESDARTQLLESTRGSSLKNYLKIKQTLSGFTQSDAKSLNALIANRRPKLSPTETLFLLLINLNTNQITHAEAADNLRELVSRKRYRMALHYFPALLNLLPNEQAQIPAAATARRFLSNTSMLDESLATIAPKTMAIVGNSPCELGLSKGKEIDASEYVIRFNNLSKLHEYRSDYGKRTDLWIVSPSYRMASSSVHCSNVGISGLDPTNRPCRYWEPLGRIEAQLFSFPSRLWYQLVLNLEAPPSAGLMALACAIESLPRNTEVRLYGFSNGVEGDNFNNHYADQVRQSDRHNWQKEGQLINSFLKHRQWNEVA